MSDNQGEIPEPVLPADADSLKKMMPADNIIEEDSSGKTDSRSFSDDVFQEEQHEDISNVVIRRVRTEPVEVIPSTPRDKGFLYTLLDTVRFISLGLVIGILLVVFVVQRNDVYGKSMEPTLHEYDAVFVEMVSKYFTEYQHGDIVTVNAEGMPEYSLKEKIIKRVIGCPGDTVEIRDGSVYLNGNLLDEPYLAPNVPTYMTSEGSANGYDNVTLGPDEYYCMGDNRGASLDSRVLGPIPESRIKAHVIARIYPFDQIGTL